MKSKPFIGLDRFQIGLPPMGYGYLFVNLCYLEGITPSEAIAKIQKMGYEPQLRYMTAENGIESCLLLKDVKIESSADEEQLGEEFESLTIAIGQQQTIAVQCIIGKSSKLSLSGERAAVVSM